LLIVRQILELCRRKIIEQCCRRSRWPADTDVQRVQLKGDRAALHGRRAEAADTLPEWEQTLVQAQPTERMHDNAVGRRRVAPATAARGAAVAHRGGYRCPHRGWRSDETAPAESACRIRDRPPR